MQPLNFLQLYKRVFLTGSLIDKVTYHVQIINESYLAINFSFK